MRTVIFVGAMLGAVSLATTGAVSTVSRTHQEAIALAVSALARNGYDREPPAFVLIRRNGKTAM